MMALTAVFTICFFACGDDDKAINNMQKPIISSEGITANPINHQRYYRGDVIPFHYMLSDDVELGVYNIEIRSNIKEAVNPWAFNRLYTIPQGLRSFEAKQKIDIPTDIDTGDYIFIIRVTDVSGWEQELALEITIE